VSIFRRAAKGEGRRIGGLLQPGWEGGGGWKGRVKLTPSTGGWMRGAALRCGGDRFEPGEQGQEEQAREPRDSWGDEGEAEGEERAQSASLGFKGPGPSKEESSPKHPPSLLNWQDTPLRRPPPVLALYAKGGAPKEASMQSKEASRKSKEASKSSKETSKESKGASRVRGESSREGRGRAGSG